MTLSDLPDSTPCALLVADQSHTCTLGELRERLGAADIEPRVIGTAEASDIWPAWSQETWRRWAVEGKIGGAWKESDIGAWRLPFASCRSFVDQRKREAQRRGKPGPKGPRAS